jgi:hypothetical protein
MEPKDYLTILSLIGNFVIGYIAIRLKRSTVIKEKKYTVYSEFLNKLDSQSEYFRTSKYNIATFSMKFAFELTTSKNEADKNRIVLKYFDEFIDYYKKHFDIYEKLCKELNNLNLICSEKVYNEIQEYLKLANILGNTFDLEIKQGKKFENYNELMSFIAKNNQLSEKKIHIEEEMEAKMTEIKDLMREEIGYYKM